MIAGLRDQLNRDEGVRLYVYQDSEGWWTLGRGRLVDRRKGGGISPEECEFLFDNDLKRVDRDLDRNLPWWRTLDPVRQGVLQNMTFQMGVGKVLGFVTTLRLLRAGQYAECARQMLTSKWAMQTPARAHRLAEQMRTGLWQ